MARILVIIEKGEDSYGAYSPDVPGCVAVGDTREEVEQLMKEASDALYLKRIAQRNIVRTSHLQSHSDENTSA